MSVSVVRYARQKKIGDANSPTIYLLRQVAKSSKVFTIDTLAGEIETTGALSQEDVIHVMKSFVRSMKKVLKEGNRVKVDGLGTFYITLTCPGVETEKECTVRNISKVNLRFMVDNTLRLVNDSIATTRSAPNNVEFVLESVAATDPGTGSGGGSEEDPSA
ncbi:HU family DNA-binding protein [uncultured Bacteroides sp.]|uniref:HU family DNA-binding protein n=1 Tax=uncultured Bacteroides sp. TaxID=162156 RepID=UPI002AA61E26|nr:HU family DNA-binding protein [uncultured Bacteroides sp.]